MTLNDVASVAIFIAQVLILCAHLLSAHQTAASAAELLEHPLAPGDPQP